MRKTKTVKQCRFCGRDFLVFVGLFERTHFCSVSCANKAKHPSPEHRFWNSVTKTEGCWLWNQHLDRDGYGRLRVHGVKKRAHVFSYELHVGTTNGQCVLHRCDNPRCVNPTHLFLGTHVENIADRTVKHRSASGFKHGMAKLTTHIIKGIFLYNYNHWPSRKIAQHFCIHATTVQRVLRSDTLRKYA